MKRICICLLFFSLYLWGCQSQTSEEPLATAPIVIEDAIPTVVIPTEQPPTAVIEPEQPTAVSTAEVAVPTETPIPPPPTPTIAAQLAQSIQLVSVLPSGQLVRPVDMTHMGDERLFIVEQVGIIRIMQNGQLLPDPFIDIRDRVNSDANEQGLLGLSFHPQAAVNGRFFVNYTRADDSTVISEFQFNPASSNTADPSSEIVLLTVGQPFENHNAGQLTFGPDGYLYIGMGDGGSANDPQEHGQNSSTLLGTMLRIDVDGGNEIANYGIPSSNPFIADDAIPNEIWATGLRNPLAV